MANPSYDDCSCLTDAKCASNGKREQIDIIIVVVQLIRSVGKDEATHDMDEDDDETDQKGGKEPLFPPSPPRASSRLGGGEEGLVKDFERLWTRPGGKLDQVRSPLSLTPLLI